ncbi:uncharacterized protein RAG0_02454 [Rhynchosporium agropyri]|uniref:ABC transporter domain-containing protein n=1 Tax=Rhynchosporium agropyri TaxID=914238 RepID=A0A1E1K200_9HELO|nr:uncharacterized protein RAG0_02454 [Rhynchosporium agropyri]
MKVEDSSKPPNKRFSKDDDETADDTKSSDDGQSADQQDILNMFTVDCSQVAFFGWSNTQYVNLAGKAIVTTAFLWLLISWQSLCAGLLGIVCLFPINRAPASKYGKKQKALMAIPRYQDDSNNRSPQRYQTDQVLSNRDSFDGIVSEIPYLLVSAINAKISCDRIQSFLRLPEKPDNTFPGDFVSFHNASVSFPRTSTDSDDTKFVLRELNIEFPNNELSVFSGSTGSGKSLLLAAILGEVCLESGYIRVPKFTGERFDSKVTTSDWIIPSAISFVFQTPWIENATIKDNILFGLPFDSIRYEKVIDACALNQDLDIFEDGDQTEVGAQGISLSGGQKWRLTLARAFYSREGIIIMDDVFSALDAHLGEHVFRHAVMGELALGRTRIWPLIISHFAYRGPSTLFVSLLKGYLSMLDPLRSYDRMAN